MEKKCNVVKDVSEFNKAKTSNVVVYNVVVDYKYIN